MPSVASALSAEKDGFEGKLTTSRWAAIAKCSQDTALRDITELLHHSVLQKSEGGGVCTESPAPGCHAVHSLCLSPEPIQQRFL
jgi:DeoR/GlpR family transcriptional regulator of sugar metabolism